MQEYELIQQMKDGDLSAFEKWMNVHSAKIERFAIQYGCTREQAGKVTEETFRLFSRDLANLDNEERLQNDLYQIALGKLVHMQRSEPLQDDILPFEEDKQLHEVIMNLRENVKVSLILSQFHNMNDVEIATIAGISTDTVKEAIAQAVELLADEIDSSLLDKRLEFLQKSYERISLSFRKDQVFAGPKEEIRKQDIRKQKISKKFLISWGVVILALVSLVIVTVVTGEAHQKNSAEEYIERLKRSFEEEIASRFAQLGLIETTEGAEYYIAYGRQAREDFELMIDREELTLAKTGKLNKKTIDKQYDEIIKRLALPSEMAEQLIKHPLTQDKDKSAEFVIEYVEQVYDIQQSYYEFFLQHQQFIEDATVEGAVHIEEYFDKREFYPEELLNALNSMEKQNIYLSSIPEWVSVVPTFAKNELSAEIKDLIHKDLAGYITLLESSTYIASTFAHPKLVSSYDETIDDLLEIENTLLANVQVEINYYQSLRYYYSMLFYGMMTDSETNRIYGSDGKVREEVKIAWKKIASGGEKSPSSYIMKIISSEMETSGWTESETQSRINAFHLNYAIGLATEGKLHTFRMSGILQTDIGWGNGFDIVSFPDPSFENLVEETYKLYSASYDPAVLKDVHPLVIFAMYYFANENEDPETMWHLYIPEGDPQSLEAYLAGWEKENFNLNEVDGLVFEGWDGSVGFQRGNIASFESQLKVVEANGWKISNQF